MSTVFIPKYYIKKSLIRVYSFLMRGGPGGWCTEVKNDNGRKMVVIIVKTKNDLFCSVNCFANST